MRIQLNRMAISGKTEIPPGDYWVSLHAESGEINLAGGGKDYRVRAVKRRSQSRSKTTNIQFFCGGGKTWSLVVTTPKQGEWAAFIEVQG